MINIHCAGRAAGGACPLFLKPEKEAALWAAPDDFEACENLASWRCGMMLIAPRSGEALFQITGFQWKSNGLWSRSPILTALRDLPPGEIRGLSLDGSKSSLAVITLSDKGSRGLREDKSGPEIACLLQNFLDLSLIKSFLLPDDLYLLRALLADLALNQKFDLIVTTGGTGIGGRDITPEACSVLLDARLPGFDQAMMAASLLETPNAMLSRAGAGLIGRSLVISLPGSLKAARCNLKAALPALKHALEKARGDNSDCGGN